MIIKTKAIVLKTIKFKETSLIVHAFTESNGLQQLIVSGLRKKKNQINHFSYFQIGSQLNIVYYKKNNATLRRLKDFSWHCIYHHIWLDTIKTAQCVFMCEVFYKSVKEIEENLSLFSLISKSLNRLEQNTPNSPSFEILFFLVELVKHLGYGIRNNYSSHNSVFDVSQGCFVPINSSSFGYLSDNENSFLSQILTAQDDIELYHSLCSTSHSHVHLIDVILQYYCHLIPHFEIKSLKVYRQLFK